MTVLAPRTMHALMLTSNAGITDFATFYTKTEAIYALDFVLAAMVESGLFAGEISDVAPADTNAIWVDPNNPADAGASVVKLYNVDTSAWEPATGALYAALLVRTGDTTTLPPVADVASLPAFDAANTGKVIHVADAGGGAGALYEVTATTYRVMALQPVATPVELAAVVTTYLVGGETIGMQQDSDGGPANFIWNLSSTQWVKVSTPPSNLSSAGNPSVNDDVSAGYQVGSRWVNINSDAEFVCLDNTLAAASWMQTTGAVFATTMNGAPGAAHDGAAGYAVGDVIVDITATPRVVYMCADTATAAAVWIDISDLGNPKFNLSATVDPGSGDDNVDGYAIGSQWMNTVTKAYFVCTNAATAAATWSQLNSGTQNNFSATTAPGTTNDSSQGYAVGSLWVNTTGDDAYIAADVTVNAAVWLKINQEAGANSADPIIVAWAPFGAAPGSAQRVVWDAVEGVRTSDATAINSTNAPDGIVIADLGGNDRLVAMAGAGRVALPSHGFGNDAVMYMSTTTGVVTTSTGSALVVDGMRLRMARASGPDHIILEMRLEPV